MRLRNIRCGILALLSLLLIVSAALASTPLHHKINLTPGFYYRAPGSVGFKLYEEGQVLESGSILTVKSSFVSPLATETKIICGSHTVSFFPGATVKILADGIQPLTGRIEIISEAALEPLPIRTGKFSGEISDGHLLLEVTPDNGTYVAMRSTGMAWFKDLTRKIFELENGHELHFPLFGPTVEMPVLSGFWSDNPSSFSAAGKKMADRTFSGDQKPGETLEIASAAEELEDPDKTSDKTASDSAGLDVAVGNKEVTLPEYEVSSSSVPVVSTVSGKSDSD